jgi:hypothetical protein
VLGEDCVGQTGSELDPDDRFECCSIRVFPADVERPAMPTLASPEPLHGSGVVRRQRAPKPAAERRTPGIVVDHEGGAAAAHHPAELGEPGFAARPEEVCPPGMRNLDGRIRHRQRLCGSTADADPGRVRVGRGPGERPRQQRSVRLDPDDRRRVRRKPWQVKTGAAADVQHRLARPVVDLTHARLEHAVRIYAEVLLLVDVRVSPDIRTSQQLVHDHVVCAGKARGSFLSVGTT